MDWDHSYFTMNDENNYMIWRFLSICHKNGWVYKGHESVPWCPRCETAISQHEMLTEDYKEVVHESVFIEFPIVGKKDEYLLVWTTTPWTIPANIAVAVDEKIEYALVKGATGKLFWIAKDLVESVFKKEYKSIEKTVLGKELVGMKYEGPFDHLPAVAEVKKKNEKFHTVVATDKMIMPITTTEGTGLVHTAVSAGTEDFMLGRKLGLPMVPVIKDDASYMEGFGEFSGKNAKKHPELIIDFLKTYRDGEFFFTTLRYKHRYPACWRCKAELVWKVADEWYIAMDVPANSQQSTVNSKDVRTLRERMISVAKQIKWIPGFGLERELDWLKNMHDWLISKKNRYWGLALPIYECDVCKTFEIVASREDLNKRAVSGLESLKGHSPHKPFIDDVTIACSTCKKELHRIDDVGNPWLDAGIIAYSTISKNNNKDNPLYLSDKKQWEEWFPADFITESFPGQFKNWFYSLIAMSTVMEDRPAFKTVLGFGTCTGEDGRPMHKSWGNAIEFNEGAEKIGVDVMRWMYARQSPADNMLFGYKKADEVRRQFYLMIWNVYKFFVDYATMEKVEIKGKPNLSFKKSSVLDEWIMSRLSVFVSESKKSYLEFNVQAVALTGEAFMNDVSTWFIRRSRDRVWVNSDNQEDKKSFYETLHAILVAFSVTVSPIMPFITDEIYTNLTGEKSVHLSSWVEMETPKSLSVIQNMTVIRALAEAGHRVRKENKLKVRQPLNSVTIALAKDTIFDESESLLDILKSELNVKKVIFSQGKTEQHEVTFDTVLTEELTREGKMRDLVRSIQEQRKLKQVKQDQKIKLTIPGEFMQWKEYIAKRVLASEITEGEMSVIA